jgi:phosphatidylglycerol---prolipoprotein diacylglyceryl transferase
VITSLRERVFGVFLGKQHNSRSLNFLQVSNLVHPQFDPVAIKLGPLAIHWYGLMYLIAFGLFFFLGRYRLNRGHFAQASQLDARQLEDVLFYGVVGVILGGRLGWILFYKPGFYLSNPLEIFAIWKGGMSFHGGLLGVIFALLLFAQQRKISYLRLMDFIAPLVPTGLAAGRMGNFINGELWGRASNWPWAMQFPQSGTAELRHPSQLYQFALEGLLLFVLIWWYSSKPRKPGRVAGFFLVGYGFFRFIVEFARQPDAFLGFFPGGLTMGQLLCVPMVLGGIYLMRRQHEK